MKDFNSIEFVLKDKIGTVWLNRPEKHNAMNAEMITEIVECFQELDARRDVRVVVLRGKGKSFCAGADLNYMKSIAEFGYEENYQDSLKLAKCFNAIYTCSRPTIALVHGAAIGGANGLLAACDFVYAAEDTKFAFAEVKLGISPATISPYVVKRIGEYGSRDLMMTGRRFLGDEAEKFGLANKSVPADKLDETAEGTIRQLMSSGPAAVTATKNLIYDLYNEFDFEESIDMTAKLIAKLRASDEGQEGMASFLEKRKPKWNENG
ncbi:MAG: enoyl-CoA hydratase/isomerase family protein [Bacteroidales bacterium]|nr:enoyl-CoA hydratase/isomerase family protein [Bacteroidales bacterium]MCF8343963.1 enoyl-CoA hydratase/isomerase family protein [Bacteroidales bacterium]MCF8352759.1 enoyl-CoA hydratase/isomerase family protein [Bacteroidales bacterium]MCF8376928.1 enoyl-CoA hydratase/isomerase family protein [Bacteroidales bacterium]MCF8400803.1 enoyl-CoA hydratase/isomerase family protein [Bacteroidales bacterium]